MEEKTKKHQLDEYLDTGLSYGRGYQFQQAIDKFQQALKLAKELKDKEKEAKANYQLGHAYRLNNQIQKAIEYYEKALEIAKEQADKELENKVYIGIGDAYRLNYQIQKAIEYYEKALKIAKEQADKELENKVYIGIGDAYRLNYQISKEMEYYEKALEIAKEQADKKREAQAYIGLGNVYRLNNQIQKAIEYYEKALEIAKERADKKLETRAYLGLGDAYRLNNQIQKAMEYYEKALEIAKERYQNLARKAMQELSRSQDAVHVSHKTTTIRTPETSDDAQLSNTVNKTSIENESTTNHTVASAEQLLILGRSYQTKGQTEEAIKSYEEAVQIANETNHNDIKTRGYHHLGNVFAEKSEYKKAIEYYQKARKISPRLEGDDLEINAYHWLGYDYLQAGQYKESIEYYNEVTKLASQLENKEREINAYLGLGSAFSSKGDFESARKYFSDALIVAEAKNKKSLQKEAYKNLALVHYKTCEYNAAVDLYLKVLEMSHDLGEKKEEWHACLMLGHTFRHLKQHEKAIKYYREALRINKELDDKGMPRNYFEKTEEGIINEWCGYCCCFVGQHQEAITCYERAKEIAKQVGDKYQEYSTNQAIGNTLCNIGNYAEANKNYQEALRIVAELGDKHREGTSYLNLASAYSKNCDYEIAIEWYKKALDIFEREFDDHILNEKALTGLAIAWFHLGKTQKAIESVQKAQKLPNEETDKDHLDIDIMHQHRNYTNRMSWSQTADSTNVETVQEEIHSTERKASHSAAIPVYPDATQDQSEKLVTFEKKETVIIDDRKRAEELIDEACNTSRAEKLPTEDLVLIEKYIEISPSYVYSRKISTNEPFTKKVRKAMTDDVKKSGYTNLLPPNDQEHDRKDGKFVNTDEQIFNFAKSEVFKNASTQKPAFLNTHLVSYMKSIGQIACGKVRGTCFLVADGWVITNYHVYRMIKDERAELGNPTLPIKVRFGYFHPKQTERIVTVEVDEEQDTTLENPLLDYKLFRLKQSEDRTNRVPLGPIVRNWQLSDGRVVILGHPEDKEMQEEVCVVIGCNARLDTMNKRYKECSGVHMTNLESLCNDIIHHDLLPYDTSFFSGSSGSPVFEMNGNIVAMHTQGYLVEKGGENISNQQDNNQNEEQENIPNQEQENTSRRRKYSLMEFGVQFISICADLKQWHGENVVKHFFPNYKLKPGEEPMDAM